MAEIEFHGELIRLRSILKEILPEPVFAHSERVSILAGDLVTNRGGDPAEAKFIGLVHDVARHLTNSEWINEAKRYGILIHSMETNHPVLLHGPVGARHLKWKYSVASKHALDGVYYHTFGYPTYNDACWAMFVADKIDPEKIKRNRNLRPIAEMATDRNIPVTDIALSYIEFRVAEADREGLEVHPLLLAARSFLSSKHVQLG